MSAGDGVGIAGPIDLHLHCLNQNQPPEVLIFDLINK